jgi:hypothetical protein
LLFVILYHLCNIEAVAVLVNKFNFKGAGIQLCREQIRYAIAKSNSFANILTRNVCF